MRVSAITADQVHHLRDALALDGFGAEVEWSERLRAPHDADAFATETIYVICNSGMKWAVARGIFDRIMPILRRGGSSFEGFKHPGKSRAIDRIWAEQEALFQAFVSANDKLAFCRSLPWIGGITCYHLAKNFGVDVAKPDVHLQRMADREGVDVQALCGRLAHETGYRLATVDTILWRAAATGLLDSRTGLIRICSYPASLPHA